MSYPHHTYCGLVPVRECAKDVDTELRDILILFCLCIATVAILIASGVVRLA